MDPNPKTFPILSYVVDRLPKFVPRHATGYGHGSDFVDVDIEQPAAPYSDPSLSSSGQHRIVDTMPLH